MTLSEVSKLTYLSEGEYTLRNGTVRTKYYCSHA